MSFAKAEMPRKTFSPSLECSKEQIAHVPSEINDTTKAYVGQLEPGIFRKLTENLEHIYTSFPEGKIVKYQTEIGGMSKEEIKRQLSEHTSITERRPTSSVSP